MSPTTLLLFSLAIVAAITGGIIYALTRRGH